MQASADRPVKTFTIGFDQEEFNEAAHARAIASYLGTDHTELHLTGADALSVIPSLPESQRITYLVEPEERIAVYAPSAVIGGKL